MNGCMDGRKCCFRVDDACGILRVPEQDVRKCGFAKPTPDSRTYRMQQIQKQIRAQQDAETPFIDKWPYGPYEGGRL